MTVTRCQCCKSTLYPVPPDARTGDDPAEGRPHITGPVEAWPILRKAIGKKKAEHFAVLCLDAGGYLLGKPIIVAIGNPNQVAAQNREIFRAAIKRNAWAIITAHNHPDTKGKPTPSAPDKLMAQSVYAAGQFIGIPMLDHLVVSKGGYTALWADEVIDNPSPLKVLKAMTHSMEERRDLSVADRKAVKDAKAILGPLYDGSPFDDLIARLTAAASR